MTLLHGVIQLFPQLVNNCRLPLQTTNMLAHIMINKNGSVLPDWNATKYVEYSAIYAQRGMAYFISNLSRWGYMWWLPELFQRNVSMNAKGMEFYLLYLIFSISMH